MSKYKHFFFDMDKTIAPSRQPIRNKMFNLLNELQEDLVIVSGQDVDKIKWQSNNIYSFVLGQNGNSALDPEGNELWYTPLEQASRDEINDHIRQLIEEYSLKLNEEWSPIEDRGCQITFSPLGNTAPIELKRAYDPDASKRLSMLNKVPLTSDNIDVKIGGTTSFDYIDKNRHKGANVEKLINLQNWNKDDCVYFGDGLYSGGNDETVIGVIETILVKDEEDTYKKLNALFN